MSINRFRTAVGIFIILVFSAAFAGFSTAALPTSGQAALAASLDEMMTKVFPVGTPGAALLIQKDGRPLVRKGYGTADIELAVPIEPDMVFRLGSMTKQFTAVAVLQLMEKGQLGLQDPITRFLPDYPTQGRTITVEHLLTHTSGIVSYTDLPEWQPLQRKDMTLEELIGLFKDKPMEFAPGEKWKYNNSGYILLGAIIEKVSGLSYEAYLLKNIFEPLGMKNSFYGSASRIIPRRIPGYDMGRDGVVNAEYLSMTQPYAAGSLLSNVDDLALWNEALLAGKPIKRATLERAWTPYKLKDGTNTRYGYGWSISEFEGRRLIGHGGGINGFSTNGILFPEERLFVVLLTNSTLPGRDPGALSIKAAALALDKPLRVPIAVTLPEAQLAALSGVYVNPSKEEFFVWKAGTLLSISGPEIARTEVVPVSADILKTKNGESKVEFRRDAKGVVTGLMFTPGFGPILSFTRTDKPLPAERKTVKLGAKIIDAYVGEYELNPRFVITFFRDGEKFMTQGTGQPAFEVFAESETKFFPKAFEALIEFVRDATGKVTGLILTQGGRAIPAKKIKT